MIKAVIFDVDGVLVDSFESNLRFFQDLFKQCGYRPPSKDEYSRAFHMPMKDAIMQMACISGDESDRMIEIAKSVLRHHELISVPEGSEKTITELSRSYKLGIVTSRIRSGLASVFEASKTEEYFETIVAYEDTERHKPEPDPLLLAAKNLGLSSHECAYIGDTDADSQAAKAAGMRFILFSNSGNGHVSSFSEIPEALNRIEE